MNNIYDFDLFLTRSLKFIKTSNLDKIFVCYGGDHFNRTSLQNDNYFQNTAYFMLEALIKISVRSKIW